MNILQGKLVNLRALEPTDLDLLYQWENNPSVWEVSNTVAPFSKFILHQYIENSTQDIYAVKQLRLVIEELGGSAAVGLIDLFDFDPLHSRVGIGVLIGQNEFKNKGFASESLRLLCAYVRDQLGLKQVYCNITSDNTQSIKLFEKCGFVICGTKKNWIRSKDTWKDELMLQLVF